MNYKVRYTEEAEADLLRLYDFLLEQDLQNTDMAEQALKRIAEGTELLRRFPFSCRKATAYSPYLRELLISFGNTGYVALFEIEPDGIVTILAIRHQRESDYH